MYKDLVSDTKGGTAAVVTSEIDEADVQYSRGLVLQELASKMPLSSPEHRSYLEQVSWVAHWNILGKSCEQYACCASYALIFLPLSDAHCMPFILASAYPPIYTGLCCT